MKCVYIICPFVSTSYLVAVQASPQAWPLFNLCGLPTGHTLRRFQSDKSSALVIRCTHYGSQRCLIKQTFQQQARRPSAVTDTWLCCVLCDRVVVQEHTCADGSWTKDWPFCHVEGADWTANGWNILQFPTQLLLINSPAAYTYVKKSCCDYFWQISCWDMSHFEFQLDFSFTDSFWLGWTKQAILGLWYIRLVSYK